MELPDLSSAAMKEREPEGAVSTDLYTSPAEKQDQGQGRKELEKKQKTH